VIGECDAPHRGGGEVDGTAVFGCTPPS
jgi:hypothetical protein